MYSILPHTADVRLFVSASTLEELFRSALEGMGEIQRKGLCDGNELLYDVHEKLEVHSGNMTTLLVDFLSDVLTLSHIRKAVFCKVEIFFLTDTELSAVISGQRVMDYDEDIKAVTYHEAEIMSSREYHFETMILFDI
jgi:SHS2 domain-containing protein